MGQRDPAFEYAARLTLNILVGEGFCRTGYPRDVEGAHVTVALAADLEAAGIKVNAACPGFTGTDLNFFRGTRTVEQAAREPVRLALIGPDGPTGTFSNEDGPLPW